MRTSREAWRWRRRDRRRRSICRRCGSRNGFLCWNWIGTCDLSEFGYTSIHAPSQFAPEWESELLKSLESLVWQTYPVIVHPDSIVDFAGWRQLGSRICIENMDKRKPIGRSADDLDRIFDRLPDANLCFDIGHAQEVDPSMTEAYLILKEHGSRLRQVHLGEVNTRSKHDVLSFVSMAAFREVAHLIPERVPVILETPTQEDGLADEIKKARYALPLPGEPAAAHAFGEFSSALR